MNGLPKGWYASRTIWAGLIGSVASIAALVLHHSIPDADIQTLATDAAAIGSMAAGVIAIWGRLRASSPIAGTQAARSIQPKP